MELRARVLVFQSKGHVTRAALMTDFRCVIAKRPNCQFTGLKAVPSQVQGRQAVEGRDQNGKSRGGGQVLSEMRQVRGGHSNNGAGEPPSRLVFSEDVGQVRVDIPEALFTSTLQRTLPVQRPALPGLIVHSNRSRT